MSATFGGAPQGTFPTIKPSRVEEHGYDDFMYLNLTFNPNAPQLPGEAGLFFTAGSSEGRKEEVNRVFIRRAENSWLYVGQYRKLPREPLLEFRIVLDALHRRHT